MTSIQSWVAHCVRTCDRSVCALAHLTNVSALRSRTEEIVRTHCGLNALRSGTQCAYFHRTRTRVVLTRAFHPTRTLRSRADCILHPQYAREGISFYIDTEEIAHSMTVNNTTHLT